MYERKQVAVIAERMLEEGNPLIQVVVGPRQTGKSTMIAQALQSTGVKNLSVSADDILSPDEDWIRAQWQQARNLHELHGSPFVLVLDEIQKIEGWPNVVKGLWDADQREGSTLKVILSGSSSLLLRKGLEDSLKGRFEVIRSPHWSLLECRDAFGYTLNDFLYYGGFPGAARFKGNQARWQSYMRESIIEPTITKDVLEDEDIRKPALMRALFELGAQYSAQELSYNKMLGQLQDAGNTTTLAHYLTLLDKAGVMRALEKFHGKEIERRKSSPRLMVYDTSLMTAALHMDMDAVLGNPQLKGHVVETAVGAHLIAQGTQEGFDLYWWREGSDEVDFVIKSTRVLIALEVKSGRTKSQGGIAAFQKKYPKAIRMVVGGSSAQAVPIEDFLLAESVFDFL